MKALYVPQSTVSFSVNFHGLFFSLWLLHNSASFVVNCVIPTILHLTVNFLRGRRVHIFPLLRVFHREDVQKMLE